MNFRKDILGLENSWGKVLEEALIIELEKKGIEFDKTKIIIREKSQLEKAIEEDDVETFLTLQRKKIEEDEILK